MTDKIGPNIVADGDLGCQVNVSMKRFSGDALVKKRPHPVYHVKVLDLKPYLNSFLLRMFYCL